MRETQGGPVQGFIPWEIVIRCVSSAGERNMLILHIISYSFMINVEIIVLKSNANVSGKMH